MHPCSTKLKVIVAFSALVRRGDLWFFSHNSGLQAQNVLYVQRELDGDSAVLLDPNKLSSDGTVRTQICLVMSVWHGLQQILLRSGLATGGCWVQLCPDGAWFIWRLSRRECHRYECGYECTATDHRTHLCTSLQRSTSAILCRWR